MSWSAPSPPIGASRLAPPGRWSASSPPLRSSPEPAVKGSRSGPAIAAATSRVPSRLLDAEQARSWVCELIPSTPWSVPSPPSMPMPPEPPGGSLVPFRPCSVSALSVLDRKWMPDVPSTSLPVSVPAPGLADTACCLSDPATLASHGCGRLELAYGRSSRPSGVTKGQGCAQDVAAGVEVCHLCPSRREVHAIEDGTWHARLRIAAPSPRPRTALALLPAPWHWPSGHIGRGAGRQARSREHRTPPSGATHDPRARGRGCASRELTLVRASSTPRSAGPTRPRSLGAIAGARGRSSRCSLARQQPTRFRGDPRRPSTTPVRSPTWSSGHTAPLSHPSAVPLIRPWTAAASGLTPRHCASGPASRRRMAFMRS